MSTEANKPKDPKAEEEAKKKEEERKKREQEEKEYIERMKQEASLLTVDEIKKKIRAVEAQTSSFKGEVNKMNVDIKKYENKIKENKEKIKYQTDLPHLIVSIAELIDLEPEGEEEQGSGIKNNLGKEKEVRHTAVIKGGNRLQIFLPQIGLVDYEELHPLDLVGVKKDTYLVLEKLPAEYDSRVKVMELVDKPKEKYTDIGGLDKQIQELEEAVVLPFEKKH